MPASTPEQMRFVHPAKAKQGFPGVQMSAEEQAPAS
jgi:hypothetical protein